MATNSLEVVSFWNFALFTAVKNFKPSIEQLFIRKLRSSFIRIGTGFKSVYSFLLRLLNIASSIEKTGKKQKSYKNKQIKNTKKRDRKKKRTKGFQKLHVSPSTTIKYVHDKIATCWHRRNRGETKVIVAVRTAKLTLFAIATFVLFTAEKIETTKGGKKVLPTNRRGTSK